MGATTGWRNCTVPKYVYHNGAECLEAEENTDTGSYDVTRVWSVLFWQTVYVAGVPLMMVSSDDDDDNDNDGDDSDDDRWRR